MSVKVTLVPEDYTGHVFPVTLGVAYDPDRAGDQSGIVKIDVVIEFDEGVIDFVPGSMTPAGLFVVGTNQISWSGVDLPKPLNPDTYTASFQWVDFRVQETTLVAKASSAPARLSASHSVQVSQPDPTQGLSLNRGGCGGSELKDER